ncbi:MAG: hypothetical protein H7X97_13345, partial [Opitutaceae bacterium]|nr:hypothetical protein [Verrucomicrobiales bacterium]
MKNLAILIVIALLAAGGYWFVQNKSRMQGDPKIAEFHTEAEALIQGIQQYKEFLKKYPSGTLQEISQALSGQGDQKVIIMATTKSRKNARGEMVDAWDTPIQFYFAQNGVMIRSAGPNKVFEDSKTPNSDDL